MSLMIHHTIKEKLLYHSYLNLVVMMPNIFHIYADIISSGDSIYLTLIFRSLHISLQKIIKDTFNTSTKGDINEENLSYEKRYTYLKHT